MRRFLHVLAHIGMLIPIVVLVLLMLDQEVIFAGRGSLANMLPFTLPAAWSTIGALVFWFIVSLLTYRSKVVKVVRPGPGDIAEYNDNIERITGALKTINSRVTEAFTQKSPVEHTTKFMDDTLDRMTGILEQMSVRLKEFTDTTIVVRDPGVAETDDGFRRTQGFGLPTYEWCEKQVEHSRATPLEVFIENYQHPDDDEWREKLTLAIEEIVVATRAKMRDEVTAAERLKIILQNTREAVAATATATGGGGLSNASINPGAGQPIPFKVP